MSYVLDLHEVDRTQIARVGGKGALLGELSRIPGVRVPPGFCVTTDAFERVVAAGPSFGACLDRLSAVEPEDREAIRALSAELRQAVDASVIPDDLAVAITSRLGERAAYAVRSSATAEDSPGASFAGQHDTSLNVVGRAAVLEHISRCWASLFSERAVTYRVRAGLDPRTARMGVVVQDMVVAQAAGVLFTADPRSGNRRVISIEATWGLGAGLVSGHVTPDALQVRDGRVVAATVASKAAAVDAHSGGATCTVEVDDKRREQRVLTDGQAVQLAELGRRVEADLGGPQDIEWCLVDDGFVLVQSRPITALFPIPPTDDDAPHVYISVGHQQMMTYAMKPLGLSLWQHTTPRPMGEAGSRLFVDVARLLASPTTRGAFVDAFTRFDPLIGGALQEVVDRGFVPPLPEDDTSLPPGIAPVAELDADPAIVTELITQARASIEQTRQEIAGKSGPELIDAIVADIERCKAEAFKARGLQVIKVAMDAAAWLNEHIEQWLGERNVADVLSRSVDHNVTSEMGLALLDVADAVRPHEHLIAFLEQVEADGLDDEHFLRALADLPGGDEARAAVASFLARYGMRCVGEIDVTRPRWSERPTLLVPAILTNVKNFTTGEANRRFEQGRREALAKRDDILQRLCTLPDGDRRAAETAKAIDRVRSFAGYRERPKYAMVSRYFVYKQALTAEADRLVDAGVLHDREDIFCLRLEELPDVLRDQRVDPDLLRSRKEAFRQHETLTPPRVLTSDGEMLSGAYGHEQLPPGALPGLAVSAGTAEGPARVAFDIGSADLDPGDILVTPFADPSWTPVLVGAAALVTEVGGLMTHGAVIAREYGLPAVVGVERATQLIQNGQHIRVHANDGYVETLP